MSSSTAQFATSASASHSASSLSFAKRRLRLGITGVGSSVLFALALFVAAWRDWLPLRAGWRLTTGVAAEPLSAFVLTLLVFWLHALLLLPVEHAGGRRAVRHVPLFPRGLVRGCAVRWCSVYWRQFPWDWWLPPGWRAAHARRC